VFVVLMLISGVAAWLFVLAQESRRVAEMESGRQTRLLMREIRAHKRTDAKLQRAKEAAEAANLAKSRYVTGISHELRTPLNTILGYAQLMQRDEALNVRHRGTLGTIQRSGEHLAGLIDGLLDIARIETGKLQLHRGEIRLRSFLDQLVSMFRLQSDARNLDFVYVPREPLPEVVNGDEKRMRQILINLLSNAIKFTEKGRVEFRVAYQRQIVDFTVKDTGVGIDGEDLERILQPFERGRFNLGNGVPGTGLGLTISKLLTDIMGGSLTVDSTPGEGSTFRVKMMLSPVAHPEALPGPRRTATGYTGPQRTVVITDDEPAHRQVLAALLAPLGFRVLLAERGEACLRLAAEHDVHLFLLDISMPDMDGWALAAKLREGSHAHTPILMVSANAFDGRKDGAPGPVHDGFLVKQVDFDQLFDRIATFLRLHWVYENEDLPLLPSPPLPGALPVLSDDAAESLLTLGAIGYVRGIQRKLDELDSGAPGERAAAARLRPLVAEFQLKRYMQLVEELRERAV